MTMPAARLPADVLRCVADFLPPPALLALCRSSRTLNALATPALYSRAAVADYCALYALARTLAARPALAGAVRSFEETRQFLYEEPHADAERDLAAVLVRLPNLRALRIVSRVELDAPSFAAALGPLRLAALDLPDLSPHMAAALDAVHPGFKRLHVHGPRYLAPAVARLARRAAPSLTHLRIDADVLRILLSSAETPTVFPAVRVLGVHGDLDDDIDLTRAFPALQAPSPIPLRCGASCALCTHARAGDKAWGCGWFRRAWMTAGQVLDALLAGFGVRVC